MSDSLKTLKDIRKNAKKNREETLNRLHNSILYKLKNPDEFTKEIKQIVKNVKKQSKKEANKKCKICGKLLKERYDVSIFSPEDWDFCKECWGNNKGEVLEIKRERYKDSGIDYDKIRIT